MRALSFLSLAVLALLAAPAAESVAAPNYWPRTPSTSTTLGWNVASSFTSMDAIADGSGGFFVTHDDGYSGHVQHVLANGSTAWPWYVFELPGATGGYGNPAITADGAGGVLVAYEKHGGGDDLRVVRVTAAGTLSPDWPATGLSVCPSSDYDYLADIAPDGEGGAFVAFIRSGPYQVFVQHVRDNGKLDSNWPADGVQIQESGSTFAAPRILPDGEGGAMIFYLGTPYGVPEILVSRVDRFGNKRTDLFPSSGTSLTGVSSSTFDVVRTGDGLFGIVWSRAVSGTDQVFIDVLDNLGRTGFAPAGGRQLSDAAAGAQWPVIETNVYRDFLVAWVSSNQVVGARRQQDLSVHPSFPTGVATIATMSSAYTYRLSISSDGAEGMHVGWRDPNEASVLRSQRLTGSGAIPVGWSPLGQVMATSTGAIGDRHFIFSDGDGGACAVFGSNSLLAINRTRRDGTHGLLLPAVLTALNDVPMDQGGKLSVYWRASEVDTTPLNAVGSYMLWRRMPALSAQAMLARGARLLSAGEAPQAAAEGSIRVRTEPATATTTYWEYLGSTPARGWAGYGRTVDTMSDYYMPTYYVPYEVFIVESVSPMGVVLGTSAPDSGFSMDNLSPAMPAAFTAARSGGATHLSWLPSAEPDFQAYRLHRGTSADFLPSDANLVATPTSPGWVDAVSTSYYYKLAAVDVHANTGHYALVSPSQTLDAPGAPGPALSFAAIAPNPARGPVSLSFALPSDAHVRLEVYDAQGRLARTLVDAALPAGQHSRAWDLRDASGVSLAPGLYLARLQSPQGTLVRRFAVVD